MFVFVPQLSQIHFPRRAVPMQLAWLGLWTDRHGGHTDSQTDVTNKIVSFASSVAYTITGWRIKMEHACFTYRSSDRTIVETISANHCSEGWSC